MTPQVFLTTVVYGGLSQLAMLGGPPPSDAAARFLLAVALQESGLTARYQHAPEATPGPARGFWQFEIGGVAGIFAQEASAKLATALCRACDVAPVISAAHRAIEGHDLLAAGLARLLLWTDPHPLPTDEDAAWQAYERCWRPGAPSRERWAASWAKAVSAVPSPGTGVVG